MRRFLAAAGLVFGLSGIAGAQSGVLVDPTRPPLMAAETDDREQQRPSGPRLQSVLISPGRRVAVISGNTITEGERYGEATVASISEGAVVLKYRDRQQTLQLVPDVEKRQRDAKEAASRAEGESR